MHPDDLETITSKRICCNCVGETFLFGLIEADGSVTECTYCGDSDATTWSVGDLADVVESAFDDHMVRTGTDPPENEWALYADNELGLTWYRKGRQTADAIEDSASIPSDAARDVQAILEDRHDDVELARMGAETAFAADACYEMRPTEANEWHREWSAFEHGLQSEARFFNRNGMALLSRIFKNIDQLRTKPKHSSVVTAGPKRRISHLYRARVFQSSVQLDDAIAHPDVQIGPPPARLAKAGRMNANGISVFYGATNSAGALAEVRPPVGSRVAVARFDIIRPLLLLDLTVLDYATDGGSIFDHTLKTRLERVAFLQTLGERLTRPVMPDDEAFDYLITQAIADFLATENQPQLDGIIYASAQTKHGRNVVLFHAAALVEKLDLPRGTKVSSQSLGYSDDQAHPDYMVWEEVPDGLSVDNEFDGESPFVSWTSFVGEDFRQPALRVVPSSLDVHHIEAVQVRSTRFSVLRRRLSR